MGGAPERLTPEEELFAYRWWRCRQAGLDADQADTVATSNIDLHEFERLIEAGCPYHLAVRICF